MCRHPRNEKHRQRRAFKPQNTVVLSEYYSVICRGEVSLEVDTYSCSRGTLNQQVAYCAVAATTARKLVPFLYPLLALLFAAFVVLCAESLM